MTEIISTMELAFAPKVQSRGRNPFKADAIQASMQSEGDKGHFLYLENRVASTGYYNMGFVCVPADPKLLRQIGDYLLEMARYMETKT